MSLTIRRILYISFILLFLIITPLIMLYASGYSLSDGFKVQKTGILIVDTTPNGAAIKINGKAQKKFIDRILKKEKASILSPAKIKNILPGEYEIVLSKEGYLDWQKRLAIKPGESTYIEDVRLFKNEAPQIIAEGIFTESALSPDKNFLAFASEQEILLLNTKNDEQELYALAASPASSSPISLDNKIIWSPDSKSLLFKNKLFSIKDWQNPIELDKIIGSNISDLGWASDSNSLYYKSNSTLDKFNIAANSSEEIYKNFHSNSYLADNGTLFFQQDTPVFTNIIAWDLKNSKQLKSAELPLSKYAFTPDNKKYLNVYDSELQILHLLELTSSYMLLRESISNVIFWEWVSENKLLYANRNEIWLFDLNYRQNILLTRISQEITNISWHPSDNYILYSTPKNIFTLELDDREKYNITQILELEKISDLKLNKQGDQIYFYSENNGKKGIYKLVIQ